MNYMKRYQYDQETASQDIHKNLCWVNLFIYSQSLAMIFFLPLMHP
jgi:hypothetical protein